MGLFADSTTKPTDTIKCVGVLVGAWRALGTPKASIRRDFHRGFIFLLQTLKTFFRYNGGILIFKEGVLKRHNALLAAVVFLVVPGVLGLIQGFVQEALLADLTDVQVTQAVAAFGLSFGALLDAPSAYAAGVAPGALAPPTRDRQPKRVGMGGTHIHRGHRRLSTPTPNAWTLPEAVGSR